MRMLLVLLAICGVTQGLSLDEAQLLTERAMEKADELGLQIAVAVVDQHGNLKAFARMDESYLVSAESARMKAYSSAAVPLSTAQLADLAASDPNHALTELPGFLLVPGGLPIFSAGGEHLGGIGIGGGSGEQDVACAEFAIGQLAGTGATPS